MEVYSDEDQLVLTYKGWTRLTNLKFMLIPMPLVCIVVFVISIRESWIFPWWFCFISLWAYMVFSIMIADQIYNREWIFNKIDDTLKLYQKRPKYYCNFVPTLVGLGPKMGLLEELKLSNIKTVSVERKKFDFYGELIRYVIEFTDGTRKPISSMYTMDDKADYIVKEIVSFLNIVPDVHTPHDIDMLI